MEIIFGVIKLAAYEMNFKDRIPIGTLNGLYVAGAIIVIVKFFFKTNLPNWINMSLTALLAVLLILIGILEIIQRKK